MMPCAATPDLCELLVKRGFWVPEGGGVGYIIESFDSTQTSAAQLVAYEQQALRERQRKQQKRAQAKVSDADSPGDGRPDGGPPTKARTDKASTGREVEVPSDQRFSGSDAEQMASPPLDRLSDRARRLRELGEAS